MERRVLGGGERKHGRMLPPSWAAVTEDQALVASPVEPEREGCRAKRTGLVGA